MPLTRREVLGALAWTAAARGAPSLAVQFYVWTQQFQAQRKTIAEGVGEAMAATRRAGYREVELTSNFFTAETRERTLAGLKEHGLALSIVYHGGPMHEAAAAESTIAAVLQLADTVRPLGTRLVTFNPDPKPRRERKSDGELETEARAVTRLAGELERRGLRLALHHHDPEMAENAREWRYLLKNTPAGLCLDLHWILRGGQDPLALLEEAGARTASLHLRNSRNNVWTEDFSEGDLDYTKVAAFLKQSRFSGYLVVELAYEKGTAPARSLEEDLRRSRQYARKLFF